MNKNRRKLLQQQLDILQQVKAEIESLKDDEQQYADDIPENLQNSNKHTTAEQAVSNLEYAISKINEAIE